MVGYVIAITALLGLPVAATALDEDKLVDLSYTYDDTTVYWPTSEPFELQSVHDGITDGGYYYAANSFCTAEHGGTHMDAPIHFAAGRLTAEALPLTALVGPAAVVDVRAKANADPDYRLTVADLEQWEKENGRLPRGAFVLVRSGWGERWPDKKRYLGTDQRGDVENLHFPGFSKEAATWLVTERHIDAIGIDTPSIDHGPSKDFPVHRIIGGADKPAFENVAQLERLPPRGATILALPMKIGGGSGAPARIIAILP